MLIFVGLLFCASSFAQATDWQQYMRDTSAPVLALNDRPDSNSTTSPAVVQTVRVKSPKKAFFLSAAIPGAGQYYNGSLVKAAGFLALEAASWAAYISYNNKGNDIDKEFHAYADQHWSENHYWDWIAQQSQKDRNDLAALREWEHASFSHGLHVNKDQQYYEMIGKYYQFNWGWDDFRLNHSITLTDEEMVDDKMISANRLYYEGRRHDSNAALKMATTATTVVILNHLFGAAEAAWDASRQNKRLQTTMRFEPMFMNNQQYTVLALRLNW
jgi:hypothetical protein